MYFILWISQSTGEVVSKTMSDKIVNILQKSNCFQDHACEFLKSCIHLFLAVLRLYCSAGLSLVAASRGCPPAAVYRLRTAVASRCGAQAVGRAGFSGSGTDSVIAAPWL